jgi:hypothetical protein
MDFEICVKKDSEENWMLLGPKDGEFYWAMRVAGASGASGWDYQNGTPT